MTNERQYRPTTKRADGQPAEKASRRKEVAFGKNAVAARSGGRLAPRQEVWRQPRRMFIFSPMAARRSMVKNDETA
jgi:hypothetical protein